MRIYGLILILISTLAFAEERQSPVAPKAPSDPHVLDSTHEAIDERLYWLANNLDSFFGEKRADDELNNSSLRLSYQGTYRAEHSDDYRMQIRFNLKVPQLQDKFRFETDEERKKREEKKRKKEEEKKTKNKMDQYKRATLTIEQLAVAKKQKHEKDDAVHRWRFNADTGINVSVPPVIFGRGRLRRTWKTQNYAYRFAEEVGWYSNVNWAEVTTLDIDRPISDSWLFRFSNIKNYKFHYWDFTYAHGPSILHQINNLSGISFNFRVNYLGKANEEKVFVGNYRLNIAYRRAIYQNWLFLEVTPGFDWPKIRDFQREPFLMVKVESLFGRF